MKDGIRVLRHREWKERGRKKKKNVNRRLRNTKQLIDTCSCRCKTLNDILTIAIYDAVDTFSF